MDEQIIIDAIKKSKKLEKQAETMENTTSNFQKDYKDLLNYNKRLIDTLNVLAFRIQNLKKQQMGRVIFGGWAARNKFAGKDSSICFYSEKPATEGDPDVFLASPGTDVFVALHYYGKGFLDELTHGVSPKKISIILEE